MALEIRPARPDEHDVVGALTVRAFATIPGFDAGHDGYTAVLADVATRARTCEILVALDDGRVVGAVTYVPGPGPLAEFDEPGGSGLRMLAVEPGHEGRGIGTALTRTCLDRAAASGRCLMVLHTSEHNVAAESLYVRLGFRRTPQRDIHVDTLWLKAFEWRFEDPHRAAAAT